METIEELAQELAAVKQHLREQQLVQVALLSAMGTASPAFVLEVGERLVEAGNLCHSAENTADHAFCTRWADSVVNALGEGGSSWQRLRIHELGLALMAHGLLPARHEVADAAA